MTRSFVSHRNKELKICNVSGSCIHTVWKCVWDGIVFYMRSESTDGLPLVERWSRGEPIRYVPEEVLRDAYRIIRIIDK